MTKKPKCNCKSAPDYHLETCEHYDVYGNPKKVFYSPKEAMTKDEAEALKKSLDNIDIDDFVMF